VRTGSPIARCIVATTELESIPPERKAPSGTSERRRWRTARPKRSRKASTGSPSGARALRSVQKGLSLTSPSW
jgi:hypothetical protein